MRRWVLYGCGGLLLFGAGMVTGKWSTKSVTTHSLTKSQSTDSSSKIQQTNKNTSLVVGPVQTDRQVTTTVTRPSGERIVTVVVERKSDAGSKVTTQEAKVETRIEYKTQTVVQEKRVTIAAPLPRWSLGGFCGRSLDGTAQYGLQAGVRIMGPIWVDVIVDVPHRAGMAGVAVRW